MDPKMSIAARKKIGLQPRRGSRTLSIDTESCSSDRRGKKDRLPTEHANTSVQEADGNFFESFTALSWKQENRRLREASEDERDCDKPPPPEGSIIKRPPVAALSHREIDLLYEEILYTIKHKVGTTGSGHIPQIEHMTNYAQQAFDISDERHQEISVIVNNKKAPTSILNVTVLAASGLEAKDANGFSDPYCMLGLMPGGQQSPTDSGQTSNHLAEPDKEEKPKRKLSFRRQSGKTKNKDKTQNVSVRDQLPAMLIQVTSVKNGTLSPVWNENFQLEIADIGHDMLHLDIWDHDDDLSVSEAARKLNEIQSMKGMGRYFKQIVQSARQGSTGNVDDFLGCLNLPLQDVPSTGLSRWFDLEGRSQRSNVQGQINLELSFSTDNRDTSHDVNTWPIVIVYDYILEQFIQYEIKHKTSTFAWQGDLKPEAATILHQYSIQHSMTKTEQSMCRWLGFSKQHMHHCFDYAFLHTLLKEVDRLWLPETLTKEEENMIAESFSNFLKFCMNLLQKQREVFPPANKAAHHKLEYLLKCLSLLHSMKLFYRCLPFQKELHSDLIHTVKKGVGSWFEKIHVSTKPHVLTDEDNVLSMVALINALNTDLQKSQQHLQKVFKSVVQVDYMNIIFKHYDKLVANELKTVMDEVNANIDLTDEDQSNIGTNLFELYLAVRELNTFRETSVPKHEWKNLYLNDFHELFKEAVHKWLDIAKKKAIERIKKAIELDQVKQIDSMVKHSTSSVDACGCFEQIREFWQRLDWPDAVGAYVFVAKVTDDICNAALFYAETIHEQLRLHNYYDSVGQFDVSNELCCTLNNIEQVRRFLKGLPDSLNWTKIAADVAHEHGEKGAKQSHTALQSMLLAADEGVSSKLKTIVKKIGGRMQPDLKKYVFHLSWSPDSVPADDAICPLMEYLDNNLVMLHNSLLRNNFDRILQRIWKVVLLELQDTIDNNLGKMPAFYGRHYDALEILIEFFYAEGKGLTMELIMTDLFQSVNSYLWLNKASTEELIDQFYIDKIKDQGYWCNEEYGVLTLRAFYNHSSNSLCVEILNARDILPLDSNGLSDPFVIVGLHPYHVFKVQPQKTAIQKNTLHPLFDEKFEFLVSVNKCRHEAAVLMLTVMDHDYMFQNDFAGEAYLQLSDLPGIGGEGEGANPTSHNDLDVVHLPLMQPPVNENQSLNTLRNRTADKHAQDFVKKRQAIIDKSVAAK